MHGELDEQEAHGAENTPPEAQTYRKEVMISYKEIHTKGLVEELQLHRGLY
jgi:hypothetical protein